MNARIIHLPKSVTFKRAFQRRQRLGFILLEAMTAVGIIALMGALLVSFSLPYLKTRNDVLLERTLRLAAQSQMERYRAGVALDTAPPESFLPDDVQLQTTTTPGTGVWSGMTKVTVTASGDGLGGRPQQVTLSGYFAEAPSHE